jgi:hypothetical protein
MVWKVYGQMPALCGAAVVVAFATAAFAQAPAPAAAPSPASLPTPRTADGHPDLTGVWANNGLYSAVAATGVTEAVFGGRDNNFGNFESDTSFASKAARDKPKYKPQYWELVRENETWGNWLDPSMAKCFPIGVPRAGAPVQIVQLKDQVIFWHNDEFYGRNESRFIPTDGRPHNADRASIELYWGDSVGKWEGDTLVIETIGFTDESWIHQRGYPHGFNMKVIERVTRTGNQLRYDLTVEDPEYLVEPWIRPVQTRNLNTNPNAFIAENLPCDPGPEAAVIVWRSRH